MQELSSLPDPNEQTARYENVKETLGRMEQGLADLRRQIDKME